MYQNSKFYYFVQNNKVTVRNAVAVCLSKRYITMFQKRCLCCRTKLQVKREDFEYYYRCPNCKISQMFNYTKLSRALYYFYVQQIRFPNN